MITPFSMTQVEDYITQYVSVHRPLWGATEYKKALDLIPSLKELVKNPFLMSLSLEVLPRMVDPGQDLSATYITRVALYDHLIQHWLERGKKRLGEKNLSPQARAAFENLIDEGFTLSGIDYLKKLSAAIYTEQDGQPIVTYSRYKDENTWKGEFFSREEEKQLLREACPLIRNGNQYRFIHRSLLEYGVALAIFDPQEMRERTVVGTPSSTRRMSTISVASSERDGQVGRALTVAEQRPDLNSPLSSKSFINEPSVLQFLEERVQQEPLFKELLLEYIEQSKKDKKWRTAAANAITILVRAGVEFIGADLQGIRVPGADISFGMFDSAQLQGADLRQADLHGAWLREANLSQVQMAGVQFGELPFLHHICTVSFCMYSPDGKTLAAVLDNGMINLYSTATWECLWTLLGRATAYSLDSNQIVSCYQRTVRVWNVLIGVCIHVLKGHRGRVTSVAYSPQGDRVASAGYDQTVRVWDVETGECRHICIVHTAYVMAVKYSPNGGQVASSDLDKLIRLWDIATETRHVLRGHEGLVTEIAYSPDGDQLASASRDKTVRLWDVATGDYRHILTGHTNVVFSVMYSPNGDQAASGSEDMSIRLWSVQSGVCLHTLLGHTESVNRVMYSPQGDLIASASSDRTARLWDTETGVCRQTLTGHSDHINSVDFSPKGDRVASGGSDKTVRLWNVGEGTSRYVPKSHTGYVWRVESSPKGDRIATCSYDKTVRFWDVETGTCYQTLRGHHESVHGIVYSPRGDKVATCSSDRTVRLWNTETGECTHILIGYGGGIRNIVYSPDGDMLASACGDGRARIWDVKSGECRHTLTCRMDNIVYSPTRNQVIFYSFWQDLLRIWDIETGVCNHTLTGHTSGVNHTVYSPQGDHVASASKDSTIRARDVGTGECRHILIGHGAEVLAYSPSGHQIASGSRNGPLIVWDLNERTCLWTLAGHSELVSRIVYSPRGDWIVSASADRSVRVWDVSSGQCRAVIQGFQGDVDDIDWIEASGVNYVATVCSDGTVGMWKAVNGEDHHHVSLHWITAKGELNMMNATIQDAQGLSQLNKQLLVQRGAVGEPVQRQRETSKSLAAMASVVSKLKAPLGRGEPVPAASVLTELSKERAERVEDTELDLKDINGYIGRRLDKE